MSALAVITILTSTILLRNMFDSAVKAVPGIDGDLLAQLGGGFVGFVGCHSQLFGKAAH